MSGSFCIENFFSIVAARTRAFCLFVPVLRRIANKSVLLRFSFPFVIIFSIGLCVFGRSAIRFWVLELDNVFIALYNSVYGKNSRIFKNN